MSPTAIHSADCVSAQTYGAATSGPERLRDLRSLHPGFGVEVRHLQVATASDSEIVGLRRLIARHGLVLFAGQDLDDRLLETVSRRLGDGRLMKSARSISHGRAHPDVANLTTVLDQNGEQIGFAGATTDYWHSDQEFRVTPATIATLYCVIPSPVGGETSFASTRATALGLGAAELAALRPLWSTRRPAPTHDNADHVEVAHPVVLGTPEADDEAIYISENTLRFIGVDATAGAAMKASLLRRIVRPENIYSHRWRTGDLLIYDNTQVVHRREAFSGERWLKATKIFADISPFQGVRGYVADPAIAEVAS